MATTDTSTVIVTTVAPVLNSQVPTGGAGEEYEFTVGGTWAIGDKITISLTNNTSGVVTQVGAGYVTGVIPTFVFTFNEKVYALSAATVYFSAINDPTTWNNPTGNNNGFIQLSDWYATAENLVAASPYQGRLAFFSRFTIQIYIIDANVANWQQQQVLQNIGTLAPFSVVNLGDLDVMFLADTGVRSLRARDLTLNAFVNDLGSPIDSLVRANINANGVVSSMNAQGVADPETGRYWLWLNDVIYVLSYYPTNQITAWSTYETTYDSPSSLLLTAMAASSSIINLVWGGAVSDLGSLTYNLYRSTLSGFFPSGVTQIATGLTGLTYSDTGLTASTTYYYYVIGIDLIGNEVLSNEASATTPSSGGSVPGPFTLTATSISNVEIDLSWTTPSGSSITYNIYRSTNPAFTPGVSNIIVTGQSGTTYHDTGVGGAQGAVLVIYYYYVIANNVSGSSTSNEGSAGVVSLVNVISGNSVAFYTTSSDSSVFVQVTLGGISNGVGSNIFEILYSQTYGTTKTVTITSQPVGNYFTLQSNSTFGYIIRLVGAAPPNGNYNLTITAT
jgi:hypothetical protein